jgi:CRISPR-associated protein Csd1
MTILLSLAALYDRLDCRGMRDNEVLVPSAGLKFVAIDYILAIDAAGRPIELKSRIAAGKKRGSKLMVPGTAYNPKPEKGGTPWEDLSFRGRTSGRRSFLFWDKSSYVFGVVAKKGVKGSAIEAEISDKSLGDHDAFVAAHRELLVGTADPHLIALAHFLETWRPAQWSTLGFPADALDKNIAFEVAASRSYLHDMPEARERAARVIASSTPPRTCLISGETAPYAVGHPMFQGVARAQSSGAALVSFNADAFVSYGLDNTEAAPVSEVAAFKYGAALNWLLERGNGRSFRLGETTVVFWADDKPHADEAEEVFFSQMSDGAPSAAIAPSEGNGDGCDADENDASAYEFDIDEDQAMAEQAQDARFQRRAPDAAKLDKNARLHILGLSPNAGRIAVRFWLVETWGHIQKNIARFKDDIRIEPPPRNPDKKAYALLFETAVQGKAENIPPRLGGELARSILSGGPYPQTLLAAAVSRIRADKQVNAERAGMCKAVINRHNGKEIIPVALDPESGDRAYNLGRLFAVYEYAEKAVADRNATIKDKYIGAASATPRRVFPILMRGYEHNASALAKQDGNKRGAGIKAAKAVSQILGLFGGEMPFPTALRLEDQGRFFVGYYHQARALYTAKSEQEGERVNIEAEGTEQ